MRFGWIVVILGIGLTPGQVGAQALPVLAARPKQLKIDGDLGDFSGARFSKLGQDDAGRAEVALAYDSSGLYVGARVFDDAFVRGGQPSSREDALVLRLALPAAGSFELSELWLYAGKLGESPASAQLLAAGSKAPRPLAGPLRIVEGPAEGGYALEAFVPWASLPHAEDWIFARGSVRLNDVDRAGGPARSVPADPARPAADLPWLLFDGGPIEALNAYLSSAGASNRAARLDYVGDIRGDARAEHLVVVDQQIVYGGSSPQLNVFKLPAADIRSAELRDLTGDRKPELIVSWQEREPARVIWRVFDLRGETPLATFGVETQLSTHNGPLACDVTPTSGARPEIVVKVHKSSRVSADNYPELAGHATRDSGPPAIVPMPLPWGPWLERAYGWNGQAFAMLRERPNPSARASSAEALAVPIAASTASVSSVPATPDQAPLEDKALFELYRQTRGIAAQETPRFAQRADLTGDSRPESVALFGRECAIVGAGFRGGRDFFYFGLPARDPGDVLNLSAQELTGDAHRELVVRIRQRIGDVTREILYVYTLADENLKPLLAVEVSRSQGSHSIVNQVSFVRERDHVVLHIAPGEARGWSAADYPFSSESSDGIATLLLPWKDKPIFHQFDGQRLQSRVRTD